MFDPSQLLGQDKVPLQLLIPDSATIRMDIVLIQSGGILLCFDNAPFAFAKDTDDLKRQILLAIDKALPCHRKEDADISTSM